MNKNLILAALLGAALSAGALLGKAKLDKDAANKALNEVREEYTPASEMDPVCLLEQGRPVAYIILSVDKENATYQGVHQLMMIQLPLDIPARLLNERKDLVRVPCN